MKVILERILLGPHILYIGGVAVVLMYINTLGLEVSWVIIFSICLLGQPIFFYDIYMEFLADRLTDKSKSHNRKIHRKYILILSIIYYIFCIGILFINHLYIGIFAGSVFVLANFLSGYIFRPLTKYIFMFKNIFITYLVTYFGLLGDYAPLIEFTYTSFMFYLYITIRSILLRYFLS